MRIRLNLATRPFADVGPAMKRLRIAMGVLVAVALVLVLGLRHFDKRAEAARARAHSLDGQIAQIENERDSYRALMRQPANALLLQQAGTLNRLFDEKSFSWTLAMEDLETVLPGGVQVSTLEPARAKDGHITLHLRVIGPRDKAVDLVRNLEHSKRFLSPRIVGENAETTGAPGQKLEPVSESSKVDFELLAEYNPASPEERKAMRKRAGAGSEESSERGESGPNQGHVRTIHPPIVRALGGKPFTPPGSQPGSQPGRAPYSGAPQLPKPNPGQISNPASGGPQ
jgi:type IV pilus assembly protein PilN